MSSPASSPSSSPLSSLLQIQSPRSYAASYSPTSSISATQGAPFFASQQIAIPGGAVLHDVVLHPTQSSVRGTRSVTFSEPVKQPSLPVLLTGQVPPGISPTGSSRSPMGSSSSSPNSTPKYVRLMGETEMDFHAALIKKIALSNDKKDVRKEFNKHITDTVLNKLKVTDDHVATVIDDLLTEAHKIWESYGNSKRNENGAKELLSPLITNERLLEPIVFRILVASRSLIKHIAKIDKKTHFCEKLLSQLHSLYNTARGREANFLAFTKQLEGIHAEGERVGKKKSGLSHIVGKAQTHSLHKNIDPIIRAILGKYSHLVVERLVQLSGQNGYKLLMKPIERMDQVVQNEGKIIGHVWENILPEKVRAAVISTDYNRRDIVETYFREAMMGPKAILVNMKKVDFPSPPEMRNIIDVVGAVHTAEEIELKKNYIRACWTVLVTELCKGGFDPQATEESIELYVNDLLKVYEPGGHPSGQPNYCYHPKMEMLWRLLARGSMDRFAAANSLLMARFNEIMVDPYISKFQEPTINFNPKSGEVNRIASLCTYKRDVYNKSENKKAVKPVAIWDFKIKFTPSAMSVIHPDGTGAKEDIAFSIIDYAIDPDFPERDFLLGCIMGQKPIRRGSFSQRK